MKNPLIVLGLFSMLSAPSFAQISEPKKIVIQTTAESEFCEKSAQEYIDGGNFDGQTDLDGCQFEKDLRTKSVIVCGGETQILVLGGEYFPGHWECRYTFERRGGRSTLIATDCD